MRVFSGRFKKALEAKKRRRPKNIFRDAFIDELVREGTSREQAEELLNMGLYVITREFRRQFKCGARTRSGTPCKAHALPNGRCRNHGGCSTGSRTPEGRARQAEATRKRWAAYRKFRNRET